jgi:hypothetical protein
MPPKNSYLNEVLILKSYADVALMAGTLVWSKPIGDGLRRLWF